MKISAIERDRRCREMLGDTPKEDLYPAYRKRSMSDCVIEWYGGYWDQWENFIAAIFSFTKPLAKGEREFDEEAYLKSFFGFCDDDVLGTWDVCYLAHYLRRYHVYFCSDGKLRYYRDEGTDKMIGYDEELKYREYCRMMPRELRQNGYALEADGTAWVNPKTGDIFLEPNS